MVGRSKDDIPTVKAVRMENDGHQLYTPDISPPDYHLFNIPYEHSPV